MDNEHVHHWIWDTFEMETTGPENLDVIEGMNCACGEHMNVDQVQDIVNQRTSPLESAVVEAAKAAREAEIRRDGDKGIDRLIAAEKVFRASVTALLEFESKEKRYEV